MANHKNMTDRQIRRWALMSMLGPGAFSKNDPYRLKVEKRLRKAETRIAKRK